MPQYNIPKQLSGLTEAELKTSREKFGFNQAENTIKSAWYTLLFDILGVMDKKNVFFETFLPCGQKEWSLFL